MLLKQSVASIKGLSVQSLLEQGIAGEALAAAVKQLRLDALNALLKKK